MMNTPAYQFDHDSSQCKLGNISATLPSIAKDEPGQLTVWVSQEWLPKTKGIQMSQMCLKRLVRDELIMLHYI